MWEAYFPSRAMAMSGQGLFLRDVSGTMALPQPEPMLVSKVPATIKDQVGAHPPGAVLVSKGHPAAGVILT